MCHSRNVCVVSRVLMFLALTAGLTSTSFAQRPPGSTPPTRVTPTPNTTPSPATPGGPATNTATGEEPKQVVIEREPLLLKPAETYRVPLRLEAAKSVDISAQFDGVVNAVLIERGAVARPQAEVIRLDSKERQLELDRAKAAYQAAKITHEAAGQGTARDVAAALLDVAQADLDLAEHRLSQCNLRAPFDGTIQQVHVVEGEFIQVGQPLVKLVDTSSMIVQIPIDRQSTKEGDTIELQVEGKTAQAKIDGVLPLTEPFEPLRELFQSIATGIAVIENATGQWQSGQTVYTSLIPRSPVTEVPNVSLVNGADGTRRVRVIRDGFVREIPVELLGSVGDDRTIVTGTFSSNDELIVRSSEELKDGTQVVPRTELVADDPKAATQASPRPRVIPPPPN